ncbi:ATP-binding cassette domain-containing protein [Salegentibacter mishustinae]|uniref:ABC transporter ATP-binding protein n=1 Tax=Salegentibacter mishustinae TaxID=270918 RepID=UPI001CE064D6|nr:ABC transporter ATP-binding protein [Salegentibacter mishustinae]UBZ07458.1 ATP-binding cassette domain-containing protein [Salegentibacter mishustinae]
MSIILKAENISKQYRLGTVGTGSLQHDVNRWWHQIRGKEDPYLKVGGVNDRSAKATEDYVWALRDINFEVKRGEVLGIIGKNGAGKSTLLKILSRVTAPTTGSIKTKGRIASLLEVGTGFHGELTGRENIFMNGAVLGMSKAEIKNKLDEIIAFSGCEKYIDTPVKRYSSGMTVRLGFAVAAHLEPEILVVDEVLAVGDAEFQKKAIGKMQDLSTGEGRTVLFVSHNMGSVHRLCSRIIVLENGFLGFNGDVSEGIDYYLARVDKKVKLNFSSTDPQSIINSIKIKNSILKSGSPIQFQFNLNKLEMEQLNIHIGIYNMRDEKLLHLTTEYLNGGYLLDSKDTHICKIAKNPLVEGTYYVNIGVVSKQKVIEEIKNCLVFEVMNSDFFNCGKILQPSTLKSKFIIPYNWY